jgi:uncharacterized RDD family membrane protein YckC
MNQFTRNLLVYLFINFGLLIIVCAPIFFYSGNGGLVWLIYGGIVYIIGFIIQIILAVIYLANPVKNQKGQAWVAALGIILLVGFSICSPGIFG